MKKNKSYLKSFVWAGSLLAVAFLVLPAIFPEDAALADKKLSAEAAAAQEAQDSALPVVFSDNPLSKFFKKLSKFYGFGKKSPSTLIAGTADYREVFPLSDSAQDPSTVVFGQEGGASGAAPIFFAAADGTLVEPDANGYTYGGQYYKNGEYPSEELKQSIESAIARYHTSASASQGLKPVYVQNPDGSLKVQYVSGEDYDRYMGGATMASDGTPQSQFLASSGRYSGAKVASRGESGSGSSSSSDGSVAKDGFKSFSDDGSLSGKFASLTTRLNNNKTETAKEAAAQEQKTKEEFEINKLQLLNATGKFRESRYVEPADGKRTSPAYDAKTFKDKPLIIDKSFAKELKENFGLKDDDFNNSVRRDANLTWPGREGREQNFLANIQEQIKGAEVFKVLSGQRSEPLLHSIHALKKQYGEDKLFFDHVGVPVNDPSKKMSERKSFTDTFFIDTGLKDVLIAADVKEDKIKAIEEEYKTLDERRKIFSGVLRDVISKDPNLKSLETPSTFLLGSTPDGSVVVGSDQALFYNYSTPASAWIKARSKQNPEKAYISVPVEEFISHLKDKGTIIIVTNPKAEEKLKALGAHTVAYIPNEKLSSTAPKILQENARTIGEKVMEEVDRIAEDYQKASVEKAKKLIADTKKGTKEQAKGVNASGKKNTTNQSGVGSGVLQSKYLYGKEPYKKGTDNFIERTKRGFVSSGNNDIAVPYRSGFIPNATGNTTKTSTKGTTPKKK